MINASRSLLYIVRMSMISLQRGVQRLINAFLKDRIDEHFGTEECHANDMYLVEPPDRTVNQDAVCEELRKWFRVTRSTTDADIPWDEQIGEFTFRSTSSAGKILLSPGLIECVGEHTFRIAMAPICAALATDVEAESAMGLPCAQPFWDWSYRSCPPDLLSVVGSALECCVCLERYRSPQLLQGCGHTICHACAVNLSRPQVSRRGRLCPLCRVPLGVDDLIPNHALKQLVEALDS